MHKKDFWCSYPDSVDFPDEIFLILLYASGQFPVNSDDCFWQFFSPPSICWFCRLVAKVLTPSSWKHPLLLFGFFFLKYLFYVVFHIKTYRILHKKGMILKSILILFSKILQFSSFIIKQKINFLLLQISSSTYKDRNEEYKR